MHVIRNFAPKQVAEHERSKLPEPTLRPDFHFVTIARHVPEKRIHVLLEAFAAFQLATKGKKSSLSIIGTGPETKHLNDYARKLKVAENLNFYPPEAGFAFPWHEASAFLFASENEGFPNVLLEALCQGIRIISLDVPFGVAEICRDGKNCTLISSCKSDAVQILALRDAMLSTEKKYLGPPVWEQRKAAGDWGNPEDQWSNLVRECLCQQ
jgi:glycosyltransferase involved in cell wall biosynthesis